ncbi:MAG: sigma factor-like helix-turn-helix DNA-binding protein [Desulfitobacteriaceae bacterium]|nr:sigma factor-like helix-turn-helix DNA-binding protein [Eubacteriales bacterium]MDD4752915.1 sigma factor-like helix-turn-helix DNA-binding protein [Desulfitobacteriaceae bacterium]
MNGIREIINCINGEQAFIYNLAYRLTGEEEGAVELISRAASRLAEEGFHRDCTSQEVLSQICREYLNAPPKDCPSLNRHCSPGEVILAKLPHREKTALVLHDVLRLSLQETAIILNEPENVFRPLLYRARNLFKTHWAAGRDGGEKMQRRCI